MKMDLIECINTRYSTRKYKPDAVPYEEVIDLINLGTRAATGSNAQPWAFAILRDKDKIETLSARVKEYLLNNLDTHPQYLQHEKMLRKEDYNIFFHAPTLILILGNTRAYRYVNDCTLAAGNIMLAANNKGLGTCWVGFAEDYFNQPNIKEVYSIPTGYKLVSAVTLGYPEGDPRISKRRPPFVFSLIESENNLEENEK